MTSLLLHAGLAYTQQLIVKDGMTKAGQIGTVIKKCSNLILSVQWTAIVADVLKGMTRLAHNVGWLSPQMHGITQMEYMQPTCTKSGLLKRSKDLYNILKKDSSCDVCFYINMYINIFYKILTFLQICINYLTFSY